MAGAALPGNKQYTILFKTEGPREGLTDMLSPLEMGGEGSKHQGWAANDPHPKSPRELESCQINSSYHLLTTGVQTLGPKLNNKKEKKKKNLASEPRLNLLKIKQTNKQNKNKA